MRQAQFDIAQLARAGGGIQLAASFFRERDQFLLGESRRPKANGFAFAKPILHGRVVGGAEKLRAEFFVRAVEITLGLFGFHHMGIGIDDHDKLLTTDLFLQLTT